MYSARAVTLVILDTLIVHDTYLLTDNDIDNDSDIDTDVYVSRGSVEKLQVRLAAVLLSTADAAVCIPVAPPRLSRRQFTQPPSGRRPMRICFADVFFRPPKL